MSRRKNESDQLTLFAAASHASHSATQESETEQQMTAISGRRCYGLFEKLDRPGLLAKTLLASCRWTAGLYSRKYALRWKMKATPLNRLLFQLAPLERHTEEIGFGLLPTPNATDDRDRGANNSPSTLRRKEKGKQIGLYATISRRGLLPTPKAQNANSPGEHGQGGKDLQTTVSNLGLLGTPTSRDWKDVGDMTNVPENGLLGRQVANLLPTPKAIDGIVRHSKKMAEKKFNEGGDVDLTIAVGMNTGMKLQPEFVEYMMGYPAGWTDLSD